MSEIMFVGRVFFSGIFLYSAVIHLTQASLLAEVARSKKVPFPRFSTIAGGVLLLTGSLSLLLGIWADLGAVLLAVFLIPTALFMHGFWREQGEVKNQELTQFLKDLALAGGAILLAALISCAGRDAGMMITGPLFTL